MFVMCTQREDGIGHRTMVQHAAEGRRGTGWGMGQVQAGRIRVWQDAVKQAEDFYLKRLLCIRTVLSTLCVPGPCAQHINIVCELDARDSPVRHEHHVVEQAEHLWRRLQQRHHGGHAQRAARLAQPANHREQRGGVLDRGGGA